ncbi:hypothetical protein [Polymorphospora sp. NPDC050346]|uniref:hypothetical protein n=1 Tax=Polymorphospora sp. NPDC050346 TaxID=3155780 RepID=UPI0033E407FD
MPERSVTAQPGIVPGSEPTAGTMFAALYGTLTPHPWRAGQQDADALFHHRCLAMGWLDDTSSGQPDSAPGLWAINDAGWQHPRGLDTGLVAWFQVEASAVAGDRPLPVQPFLRCAQDATARAGTLELSAIQILLPVHGIDPSRRPPYAPVPALRSVAWFAAGDPHAHTPVQVSVNSGQDPALAAVAAQLTDQLTRLDQTVFANVSHDSADPDTAPPPPFDDSFWSGPPLHGATLRGDLIEWTCEAIGWLAEAVADCAARLGVASPLLLTVARTTP